jgi:pimeloyl-ACP methyl ester carboxylesterase
LILACVALAAVGLLGFTLIQTRRIERRFPPTGKFADAGGARLHATFREPLDVRRETIVLIHGASGNQADMMLPLGDALAARGFRVVAVDRPGHGWSERLAEDRCSPAGQAETIRAGLESLGVERAIVVGHSWAGSIAVNMLIDHADFCTGAVLLAPVTHPWPGGVRWYYKLAATPFAGWLFAHLLVLPLGLVLMEPSIAGVFAPSPEPPDYADRIGAPLALRPEVFRANARDVAHLRAFLETQAPRMGGIRRPVAILSGDHDGVVLTECHSFGSARDIPGATLTMMKNVGHSPHWADPSAVIAQVEAVFARGQSAGAMRPDISPSAPSHNSQ